MATHRTKPTYITAAQFNGGNGLDLQAIAGTHQVDGAGHYTVPNFDYADYWWPKRDDPSIVAVLWVDNVRWVGVRVGDWLFQKEDGTLGVCSEAQFDDDYEAI